MSRQDRPIVIEREASSSLWWFLLGGTLGAGLALLFAPHSGDRTRRLVGRKLSKLRDAADVALEDLRDALSAQERVPSSLAESGLDEEDTETVTEAAEEAVEREERAPPPRRRGAGTAGGGTASARRELEQRLAEARARRHRSGADEDEEPVA